MALQTTTRLTYDDYALIPDDGLKHEIIDGEHYVNGTPDTRHQRVNGRLLVSIANFLRPNAALTLVETVDIDGTITTPLLPGLCARRARRIYLRKRSL